MSTIAENLQTIKNSTDAIKQAIIDKGGTISGDITTWADAISGIESGGGGSADGGEPVFQCNLTCAYASQGKYNITGNIDFGDNYPGPGEFHMYINNDGLRSAIFTSSDTPISFTNVYLYGTGDYLMFAVYVPDSTNTYVILPDEPGAGAKVSVKSFYKVNVTFN